MWCFLALGCQGTESSDEAAPGNRIVLGDEKSLASFDYETALVTHGLSFAEKSVASKTLEAARLAGNHACKLAQHDENTSNTEPVPPLGDDVKREIQRRGTDPYLGLEIARIVAACYSSKLYSEVGTALGKAMFLSLASNCASRRGTSSESMSKLMLALYDSQEVNLSSYLSTLSQAKARPSFSRHLFHGTQVCPEVVGQPPESTEPEVLAPKETNPEDEGRVYVGLLRGRAPGRIRLIVKDREIEGVVTIGSKKLVVDGKVGRFNTLNMTGRLGMESIELRGKLKARARKMRGRYNGKIRRRNQPRASRVIGFWEANLDTESAP